MKGYFSWEFGKSLAGNLRFLRGRGTFGRLHGAYLIVIGSTPHATLLPRLLTSSALAASRKCCACARRRWSGRSVTQPPRSSGCGRRSTTTAAGFRDVIDCSCRARMGGTRGRAKEPASLPRGGHGRAARHHLRQTLQQAGRRSTFQ